jgi:hypothetical protein
MIALILNVWLALWFALIPTTPTGPTNDNCPDYEPALAIHGLPYNQFSYVAWRESRCDPTQINWDDPNGGSYGLLQINAIHLRDMEVRPELWRGVERCETETTDDLLVAWKNICVAGFLYRHAGGEPWGVQ